MGLTNACIAPQTVHSNNRNPVAGSVGCGSMCESRVAPNVVDTDALAARAIAEGKLSL
jgi:hypothetical protein